MSFEDESDRKLIEQAQNGNKLALEKLVEKHQGMIRALAGRLCCSCLDREELIQAGNLGLLCAIGHYHFAMNTKLITYAVPWILGEMRRAIRKTEHAAYSLDQELSEEGLSLYEILGTENDANFRYLDLRMAVSRLSRDEQLLIILRYYRDRTQRESAEILGKSQTQISRIERHALDALHAMLS